ncbi:MAG: isochorismate synthase [Ardenticatenaceae bacterium]|nr:isochorismate synthase [Ardenticatenaceae bacterium]MCB8990315.1 isochorismate synthase [Ardenticatenaceae bacterium]
MPEVVSLSQKKVFEEGNGRLLSYSQPSPGVDMAGFLRHAHGQVRVYWQDGQDPVAFAGFGVAAEIFAWGDGRFRDIQRQAEALFHDAVFYDGGQPLSAPRLMGGFAFRDDFSPDYAWAVFHPAHFILPHYQLVQANGETWLTINAILPRDESASANLPMLQEAWQTRYELLQKETGNQQWSMVNRQSSIANLRYPMPYDAWETMLNKAIGRIRAGAFKKVVLARVAEARFAQRVDVENALAYLNETYAGCYRFLFEVRPYHAFFGATPELLVQTNGQRIETMGLAGSIRRGATPEEDAALAHELLHSAKNRHEQQLVVESIQRRLHHAVHSLHIPEPAIYQLSNIQHIHTPIIGILRDASGVLPMVERLHPTPALGGTPRRPALEFLRDAEPVPRGWYGAPVGWIDHTLDGKFAVAIRSAVTQENRVWMYAGAGIVADSEPQKEWDETALKFRPMLDALGIVNGNDFHVARP